MDLLAAINWTIEESIDCKLHASPFLGLVIDESTDVAVYKKLAMYIRVVDVVDGKPSIHFVRNVNIVDGKAATIVEAIVDFCKAKNLKLASITSLASDGASVMVGRKNGVGACLREKYTPHLIQVHCVAHCLALAAANACKAVPFFDEFQRTIKSVYYFYSSSAVRYNSLRELQQVLDDNPSLRTITLKEPASFRWLSLHQAVKAVFRVFPALCLQLDQEAAVKKAADAKGLLNQLQSVKFVMIMAFLLDVLDPITKLSKVFQRDLADVTIVRPAVDSTIAVLESFMIKAGPHLQQALNDIHDCTYKEIHLKDNSTLRTAVQTAQSDYLQKLVSNLNKRFEPQSLSMLEHLNQVLNPACLDTTTSGLPTHGEDALHELIHFYGKAFNIGNTDIPAIIDPERTQDDFLQFKYFLKSLSSKPYPQVLSALCTQTLFPDFRTLAQLMLVSPVTSVSCERAFSAQNLVKTKQRASLSQTVFESRMRVRLESPNVKHFDTKSAAIHFCAAKQRRK